MSLAEGFKKGMVIRHEGKLYSILDHRTAHTGKQKPTVHVKLRAIASGHTGEKTLDELGKLEEVPTEIRHMQYLYAERTNRVFMDEESYEQYPLTEDVLGESTPYLIEQETYSVMTIEGQPVALQLPDVVAMEVVDTAPPQHAGGTTNVHKEAKLASGLTIQVPLFIKNGDKVRIHTGRHEYVGKEH